MKPPRIEVGKIRREQIVEAAVAVIAERGLQNLSLSAIEKRTGMSRGQLTYYFRAKEDILLAVFDRLLQMMHRRARGEERDNGDDTPCAFGDLAGLERLRAFMTLMLLDPPPAPEFHSLQYTFLSQIGHREDYRQRLASLYGEWRQRMGADLAGELEQTGRQVKPATFATFVQALLHGLAMQRAADPNAYDREDMLKLFLEIVESYFRPQDGKAARAPERTPGRTSAENGKAAARNGNARSPRSRSPRPSKTHG
jgi:AcrR family transcriptional regulator